MPGPRADIANCAERLIAAVKTLVLTGIDRAGYVLSKRDAYRADRQRMAQLEAALAAEQQRVRTLEEALAADRQLVPALQATLAAERRRAEQGEAARAEVVDARLAAAHAERQLEQARAALWAARQATRFATGGADATHAEPPDGATTLERRPHRIR